VIAKLSTFAEQAVPKTFRPFLSAKLSLGDMSNSHLRLLPVYVLLLVIKYPGPFSRVKS